MRKKLLASATALALFTTLTTAQTRVTPPSNKYTPAQDVELGLQAGRIRAVYGPGGEQAALRLFRRLPAGAGLAETARSVSAALTSLNGRSIESFRIEVVGPGMYRIALNAGGAEVAVRLDRSGVQLASIGV